MRFVDYRFFIIRLILVSIDMPKSDFEFGRIFMELFVLKIQKKDSPLVTFRIKQYGSIDSPLNNCRESIKERKYLLEFETKFEKSLNTGYGA
jgi:hypothetical protein